MESSKERNYFKVEEFPFNSSLTCLCLLRHNPIQIYLKARPLVFNDVYSQENVYSIAAVVSTILGGNTRNNLKIFTNPVHAQQPHTKPQMQSC